MALEHGERNAVELSEKAVLAAAVDRTGLDDFGPDDFRVRLRLWLEEVDGDPERSGLGRLMLFRDCVRYASNRLRIRHLLLGHPEIHDVEITAPIVVVGLPRSGTTHLVNLIAADTRLRSLPMWESYEPVPDADASGSPDDSDPRYRAGRAGVAGHGGHVALPVGHAPHAPRPRARGAGAPIARLLELPARMGGPSPALAGLLPGARPDAALRVPEDGAPDPAVAPSRRALGAQVPSAPRAAGPAAHHLPRRHCRRHPPGPGVGGAVGGDHDGLRRPHELPDARTRSLPLVLDRSRPAPARVLAAPSPPDSPRSAPGRALPRIHGGRRGDGRAHLRRRRPDHDRRGPPAHHGLCRRPPPRQRGPGRL